MTASFGHLIPTSLIESVPDLHALNIHPSLLPKYRGAAPIQWAIANGDTATGVTLQELSKNLFDRGRILHRTTLPMPRKPVFDDLQIKLAHVGASLLFSTLQDFEAFKAKAYHQDGIVTKAPKVSKEDGRIDWKSSDAEQLGRWHRGFSHQVRKRSYIYRALVNCLCLQVPFWTMYEGHRVQLLKLKPSSYTKLKPGQANLIQQDLVIGCNTGSLSVQELKTEGRKGMRPIDWWNGSTKGSKKPILFENIVPT